MDLSEHNWVAAAAVPAGREITVPLSALFRDPLNVRKKSDTSVDELAALICSQSLLQNLVVRRTGQAQEADRPLRGGRRWPPARSAATAPVPGKGGR
jgi:ParB-like chromosome segregation protein Spo0J